MFHFYETDSDGTPVDMGQYENVEDVVVDHGEENVFYIELNGYRIGAIIRNGDGSENTIAGYRITEVGVVLRSDIAIVSADPEA